MPYKSQSIIHNVYNLTSGRFHSITVDGVEGLRVDESIIARNGIYAACLQGYRDELPRIFKVTLLEHPYNTTIKVKDELPDTRYPHPTFLGIKSSKRRGS